MEVAMRRCAACGNGRFRKGTEVLSADFPASELEASVSVPARQCTKCKEAYVDGRVVQRFELAVARELANLGLHTGETFRYMRKVLGLRAVDLAQLLDVTPETISHWETGKVPINRAALAALGAMIQDAIEGRTTTRDRLRALGDDRPRPKVLHPRLARAG
jgi:putative zinc finger/helix-turn-helix YgiT family protein